MKKLVSILVLCLFVVASSMAFAAEKTKIAVASDGNTPSAAVSPVAARSSYYLIFDSKGTFIEAVVNPHKSAGGGASSLVIDFLSGKDVKTIIAGAFGDRMIPAMKAKGVSYIVFKGTAADAITKAVKK